MPTLQELLHELRWRTHWRVLLVLFVAITAWFAFQPGPGLAPGFTGADKLQHMLAFGAMAFAGGLGLARRGALVAGLLAYGVFIEVVQQWVPGRDASAADVLADAFGIALGLATVAALRRLLHRAN